jgi:hypothetical protein
MGDWTAEASDVENLSNFNQLNCLPRTACLNELYFTTNYIVKYIKIVVQYSL